MKSDNLDILKKKGTGFKVPDGYFDSIENAIMSELITQKFSRKPGFAIPEGYFDAVEDTFIAKLSAEHLPEKEGFATPEGYFDSIENAVFTKLDKETSQKNTSDVPEGYFETFEDRVFARLVQEKSVKEPRIITLGSHIRKVWAPVAVAASLAILAMLYYSKPPVVGPDLVVDELIEENLINLDSYEIAEVFSDVDLAANEAMDEDEELLDYLNGTDVESLLLEN